MTEQQEQQEQYTELEKEAQKWLDETDTMQFSQMELLTMFAAHQQVKNNDLLHDVSCCDFALWLQDNYSTNKKQGEAEPLPKGYWRKDFTNEHYSITELIALYNRSCS